MSWRETVMHIVDLNEERLPRTYAEMQKELQKQAEISFKAGIKEVVEWMKGHANYDDEYNKNGKVFILSDWQAKLKEWEIEGGEYGTRS